MQKKSGQVALGGIATGMCIALMFATGMIPFSYYALPALAGLVLIAVREENGLSTALIVFAAVSLLQLSIYFFPLSDFNSIIAAYHNNIHIHAQGRVARANLCGSIYSNAYFARGDVLRCPVVKAHHKAAVVVYGNGLPVPRERGGDNGYAFARNHAAPPVFVKKAA